MNTKHERHPLTWFRHFEPNPRRIDAPDFVVLCRSIASFGLVDTLVALEDGRVLGGNQRLDAVIQLAKGFDVPRPDGKGTERLQWSPPDGLLDVMVVRGVDEATAKAINVALNKHAGTFIEDELARILREVRDARPELLGAIETDDEIERLLADVSEGGASGDAPKTKGVPSITLQFTSAAAHTRVKQALAAAQKKHPAKDGEKVPSGDLLDLVLAAADPKRPKPNGKPAKARPRA